MPKKRSSGEGSIFQRKDGRWVAQMTLPNGKRKTKYAKSQKEARTWLLEAQKALSEGLLPGTKNITLGQLLDRVVSDVFAHSIRPTTLEVYEKTIAKHVKPHLGYIKLEALSADHLQHFYSERMRAGVSPTRVRQCHLLIHRVLEQAVKWGLAPRNVADRVDPPKLKRRQMKTLTPEEVKQFLEATRDDYYYPLWVTAIGTGMRQGELLGLRWEDTGLENGLLRVTQTLAILYEKGKGEGRIIFSEPKTDSGRRSIVLPHFVVHVLKEHRVRQLERRLARGSWPYPQLVFTNHSGKPVNPENVREEFKAALEKAGLPRVRFHDLRHTAATLLLIEGTHPKVVQEMLGHSSISITLGVYSHVLPQLQHESAQKMSRIMGG